MSLAFSGLAMGIDYNASNIREVVTKSMTSFSKSMTDPSTQQLIRGTIADRSHKLHRKKEYMSIYGVLRWH